jgi:TPR repeat protein
MKNLATTLSLTLVLLLGSIGTSSGNDFLKGLNAYHSGDFTRALSEWMPLAEKRHSPSQYNLGFVYYRGEGVPQDYETAVKWYTLAAEQGDPNAQNNLGVMYANGQGLPEDFIYAHMWFSISALNGNATGRKSREIIERRMIAAQIGIAEELAQKCARNQYKNC